MSHYADLRDEEQPKAPQSVIWQQPHVEPAVLPTPAPVKSDGGSSSYYDFTIHSSYGGSLKVKTGDVIRAMVENDFELGNILKACRRVSEFLQGRGKAGTDANYDLTKIAYFAEELKAALGRVKQEAQAKSPCWEEVDAVNTAKEVDPDEGEEVYVVGGQKHYARPYTSCLECVFYRTANCAIAPCSSARRPSGNKVIFIEAPLNPKRD